MQPNDRRQFGEALTQLFAVYGAELTDRVLTAWWGVLAPYKLTAVLAAMNLHAGDIERGMFRPTPADVKKHLEVTIPRMMDERRAKIAAEAQARIAPLRDRIATIENDVRLGLANKAEADVVTNHCGQEIYRIIREKEVALALAPGSALRDQEAEIAPRDRLPDVVRRALGWLGKRDEGKRHG